MNKARSVKKIIFILLVLFIMFITFSNVCYAGEIISGADDFISDGSGETKIDSGNLKNLSDRIYNILLIIGMAIAIIVGLVLGIQFMTGSVETKSKVKESLIPYIAGCVVIFGAFGIWKLVVTILRTIQ